MNTLNKFYLTILIMATLVLPAQASDLAKEKRWAAQIVDVLFEGKPVYLNADGQKFLAILTPSASDKPIGAVILLHGRGVHPDWSQVISPLRTRLPEKNWTTLSLQMPVLPNVAKVVDYVPLFKEVPGRIKSAIDFLNKQGIKNIVIIGHSMGAAMATYYLANSGDSRVKAFIGIGMSGIRPEAERVMDNEISLAHIKRLPVLDIYGSDDLNDVLTTVQGRANAIAKIGNSCSRQVKVEGANHFHVDREDNLVEVISQWLINTIGKC